MVTPPSLAAKAGGHTIGGNYYAHINKLPHFVKKINGLGRKFFQVHAEALSRRDQGLKREKVKVREDGLLSSFFNFPFPIPASWMRLL